MSETGIRVTVDVSGLDRLLKEEPQRVGRWLRGVGEQMVGDIKLSMGTSPPGITYRRGPKNKKGAKTHTASKPGYAPNVDIGTLRASIHLEKQSGPYEYHISDGVIYGKYLEFGTARGMAARPFMRPVFDKWQKQIEDDARKNLNLE